MAITLVSATPVAEGSLPPLISADPIALLRSPLEGILGLVLHGFCESKCVGYGSDCVSV
jgi:hypothetical protein